MANYGPYTAGTISVTNGSPTVTGTSTTWNAANFVTVGSQIVIAGVAYRILSVNSTTSITLTTNYSGATASGLSYTINEIVNPAALTASDNANIGGGVTVVITNVGDSCTLANAWSNNGVGLSSGVTNGKLRIQNTSTVTGMIVKCKVTTSGNVFNTGGLGTTEIVGGWIQIGTGTGASGQAVTHWDTNGYWIPCVWVETGSGTGVFEKYLNIGGHLGTTHTVHALSAVGAGNYGRFFTQGIGTISVTNGSAAVVGTGTNFTALHTGHKMEILGVSYIISTITDDTHLTFTTNYAGATNAAALYISSVIWFGNGTNGKAPPSGAVIRVPNILCATVDNQVSTFPYIAPANGQITLDTVQFSRWQLRVSTGRYDIRRCSFISHLAVQTQCEADVAYMEDCGFSSAYNENTSIVTVDYAIRVGTWKNVAAWSAAPSNSVVVNFTGPVNLSMEDCQFYQVDVSTTDAQYALGLNGSGQSVSIKNGLICGGVAYGLTNALPGSTYTIDGTVCVENPLMLENSTSTTKAAHYIKSAPSSLVIKNTSVPVGGGFPYAFLSCGANVYNLTLSGNTINSSYQNYFISFGGNSYTHQGWRLYNNYVAGYRAAFIDLNSLGYDLLAQNMRCGMYSSTYLFIGWTKVLLKGWPYPSSFPLSTKPDNIFAQFYNSATTGGLNLGFAPPSEYSAFVSVLSGSPKWARDAQIYLNAGDSVEYAWPHKILGVTSFTSQAGNPNLFSSMATYSIDRGSGWSDWKTLDGATLGAEAPFDPAVGFNLKIRLTYPSGTQQILSNLRIDTNNDQSVLYPTATGVLTLSGLKTGSEVRIYNHSTGVEMGGIESTSSDTFQYTYDYYGSDIIVDVVVFNLNYQYVRYSSLALGASGLSVPVQQQLDRQYLNPP